MQQYLKLGSRTERKKEQHRQQIISKGNGAVNKPANKDTNNHRLSLRYPSPQWNVYERGHTGASQISHPVFVSLLRNKQNVIGIARAMGCLSERVSQPLRTTQRPIVVCMLTYNRTTTLNAPINLGYNRAAAATIHQPLIFFLCILSRTAEQPHEIA